MSETTPERETGSETISCPHCGKTLAVETAADGSTSPVNCTKCFPAPTKKEIAASQEESIPREVGTSPANQPVSTEAKT